MGHNPMIIFIRHTEKTDRRDRGAMTIAAKNGVRQPRSRERTGRDTEQFFFGASREDVRLPDLGFQLVYLCCFKPPNL